MHRLPAPRPTARAAVAFLALCAALTAACDPGSETPAVEPASAAFDLARGAITLDHEAILRFQGDWNTVAENAPILAGGKLRIDYDPQRLPHCRATKYGLPAWSILVYTRWNGAGEVKATALASAGPMLRATLQVPETAKKLELWFYNNDAAGCKEYDSAQGANYPFDVAPPSLAVALRFKADASESADAPLVQGGLARVVYAAERLPACRHTVNGARAWNLYASWRFLPGGQVGGAALLGSDPYSQALIEPVVALPPGATAIELWFSNSDTTGCVGWDSDFAKNYPFPIVAASGVKVGWAGDFDFVLTGKSAAHQGDVDPAYYFDSWQGMPLASAIEVQTWIAGITDKAYASPEAAKSAATVVKAELRTDAVLGAGGAWTGLALKFERQQGNNFVWSFRLGDLRFPQAGYNVADGLYHYTMRFSVDGGATWLEVGKTGDKTRRFVLAPDLDCKLFPDAKPAQCPKDAAVGWAGTWGGQFTHACNHEMGLADPVIFTKSALGHDCMVVTAEVWVAGVTDKDAKPGAVLAEVETDIAYGGGPLTKPVTYPLTFAAKVGNNFRFAWHTAQLVGMAAKGDYTFRFRFSADAGKTWYTIGKGDGPQGGTWRKLWVRNDSLDAGQASFCEGLSLWDGASNSFPTCQAYQPSANFPANNCEFYVNSVGRGAFAHNSAWAKWLEAWLPVAPQNGVVQTVGMWVRYIDAQGGKHEVFSLGKEVEPSYWKTGFTYERGGLGIVSVKHTVDAFAFFVDVKRPNGKVERLWQSADGQNYSIAATWSKPGFVLGIGSGSIEYADESAAVFNPKKACKK